MVLLSSGRTDKRVIGSDNSPVLDLPLEISSNITPLVSLSVSLACHVGAKLRYQNLLYRKYQIGKNFGSLSGRVFSGILS